MVNYSIMFTIVGFLRAAQSSQLVASLIADLQILIDFADGEL